MLWSFSMNELWIFKIEVLFTEISRKLIETTKEYFFIFHSVSFILHLPMPKVFQKTKTPVNQVIKNYKCY